MSEKKDSIGMKDEIKKKMVACYIRVSTEEQTEEEGGYGIPGQLDKIKKYVGLRGEEWELPDKYIFIDSAVSGASDINERPELTKLFKELEYSSKDNMPFEYVLVYKVDRFARKLSVLLQIVEGLKNYGVGFVSCTEAIDTSTPFGTAMLGILGIFAELERSMIQERTSNGREQALKSGAWMNDKYGYIRGDRNLPIINKEEADVIKLIFNFFVYQRYTITQITKELRDRKIPIPTANKKILGAKEGTHYTRQFNDPYKWGDKKVRDILSDEIYIGKYYYNKTTRYKDPKTKKEIYETLPKEQRQLSDIRHIPIIEDDMFERAQELLANKGLFTKVKSNSDYLLTGLLKCGHCAEYRRDGKPLGMSGTNSGGRQYYQCDGKNSQKFDYHRCNVVPLPKEEFEHYIVQYVYDIYKQPNLFKDFASKKKIAGIDSNKLQSDLEKLYQNLAKHKQGIENTKTMFQMGDITTDEYDNLIKENKKRIVQDEELIKSTKKRLKEEADITRYEEGIKIANSLIKENIDRVFNDRVLLKRLLAYTINYIVVLTRPATPEDKITGRKKKDGGEQFVPAFIDVHHRLPQEILTNLYNEIKGNSILVDDNIIIEGSGILIDSTTIIEAYNEKGELVIMEE